MLSLAKLKTLEYRLFRKMREKLRGFYAIPKGEKNKILDVNSLSEVTFNEKAKKFETESKQFLEGGENSLP